MLDPAFVSPMSIHYHYYFIFEINMKTFYLNLRMAFFDTFDYFV